MDSFILKIKGREYGSLQQSKTFSPIDGPLYSISNEYRDKTVRFIHAACDRKGIRVAAGDQRGNVYLFHQQKNKFWLVQRLNLCCTFLTFSSDANQEEVVVALSDCSVVALDSGSNSIRNQFRHHKSCVSHASFDSSGRHVVSCSTDQAILWDFKTFRVLRMLTLRKQVDVVKVFFLPDRDEIVSAFRDDSVFLWNYVSFECLSKFTCTSEGSALNVKTVDASADGRYLACAGRADWFYVWDLGSDKELGSVALPKGTMIGVRQLCFLPRHFLSVLSRDGVVHFYDLDTMTYMYKLASKTGKIISYVTSLRSFVLSTIAFEGHLEIFDVKHALLAEMQVQERAARAGPKSAPKPPRKVEKAKPPFVDRKQFKAILRRFGVYPDKHRFFIWSHLLRLPHNAEEFAALYQESLKITLYDRDYEFMNPGVRKAFVRVMAMLATWCPLIREMHYVQCVAFPFIKVLHRNPLLCFELLVAFIGNWCQSWFVFCPFAPFNALCVVEGLLAYHDRALMAHFLHHDVTAEVYAWALLQTSFSEVFDRDPWLRLWDHAFSNPTSFLYYAVAAYNVALRDTLLMCRTRDQFKSCYTRHGLTVDALLRKTYDMRRSTPTHVDPGPALGEFVPIPQGNYPAFLQMAEMDVDLETLATKRAYDQEVDYLRMREEEERAKGNYLLELQELQMLRRKLLLERMELRGLGALEELDAKLTRVQVLLKENMCDQMALLKHRIGESFDSLTMFADRPRFFDFQDYITKIYATK